MLPAKADAATPAVSLFGAGLRPTSDRSTARSIRICNSRLVMSPLRWGRPSPQAGPHRHATSRPDPVALGAGNVINTDGSAPECDITAGLHRRARPCMSHSDYLRRPCL